MILCALLTGCSAPAGSPRLLVATTHTLEDSGLLDSLVARFHADHPEQDLQVVVAGSGEVLTIGRRGDADALLTHAPADELAFVEAGYGSSRRPVMHNEFIVAGPAADPAVVRQARDARDAFSRIRSAKQPFVSRADDSGTHKKELAIWEATGAPHPGAPDYIEAGAGMADALRIADQRNAYVFTDVATFMALRERLDLVQLHPATTASRAEPLLRNDYSVMIVTHAHNAEGARVFVDWVTSAPVQRMISEFGRSRYGRALFTGDAGG
jgi:tungstate transport system substrate-binding protein